MGINTTTAVITANNAAADSGSVNPVMLWIFAVIGLIALGSLVGPLVVAVVEDIALSVRCALRGRRPATR